MIKAQNLKPLYKPKSHRDFRELLKYAAEEYGDETAFILKVKKGKDPVYKYISFKEFFQDVNALGTGLMNKGLLGKRIAIIGKNSYQWIVSYFATLCGLGICIPLDKGLPVDEAISSLERSYADAIIFDNGHKDMIEEIKNKGGCNLDEFIPMEELEDYVSLPEIMEEGSSAIKSGDLKYSSLPIDPSKMSIILFTSGTTSMSKAVILSQKNITENIYAAMQVEDIRRGDINMAFLPYHHTFGSTGQILMLAAGATTTFCDGLKYLQKNMVEYHVSVFVCVPLLIESIYKKVLASVKKQGKEKTFNRGMKLSGTLLKVGIDVRRKLFKDVLDQLGGNLRFVISGASAIDPEAMAGFKAIGINTVQGYGMTEAAPMLAAESPKEFKNGSIGRAMPGVELAIVDENAEGIGELIAKGPNVMAGYYENQEETDKVIIDGWLHTGDLASIDEDGYIFIRGRKKNVIVLKNGKNVYPEEIETLIAGLPYVEENMVFGEKRHKDGDHKDLALCAKIVYNPAYMQNNYGTSSEEEIKRIIKKDLSAINDELPNYKQVLRLIVTNEPMVKTTTGKVKRYVEESRTNK